MYKPEGHQRIVTPSPGNQAQQIVREPVPRILAIEIEAAAGGVRSVVRIHGTVVVLVPEIKGMAAVNPVCSALEIPHAAPQPAGHAPRRPKSLISVDIDVRQAYERLAPLSRDALNARLFGQVVNACVWRREVIVRFQEAAA